MDPRLPGKMQKGMHHMEIAEIQTNGKEDDEELLDGLFRAMIHFDEADPARIQHFTKVHSYARLIGRMEGLDADTLFALEAAAYVHDIGIRVAERKYGFQNGKLQEQEGPEAAEELMKPLGFSEAVIRRVRFLVGHHHTYTNMEGADYQILVEADFLVNLFESSAPKGEALSVRERIFRTASGRWILDEMFGLTEDKKREA